MDRNALSNDSLQESESIMGANSGNGVASAVQDVRLLIDCIGDASFVLIEKFWVRNAGWTEAKKRRPW
jgi:hypothetical protein